MKNLLLAVVSLFFTAIITAQVSPEEKEVQKVVDTFFEGFHSRDSVVMKSAFYPEPVIQTIGRTQGGETKLLTQELGQVLKGIVSIPAGTDFKEVLHDYVIKIDGDMANAWTPYSFYMNGNFSHCGVNNFQLLKQDGQWKIIYLIDTRRREGCDQKQMD